MSLDTVARAELLQICDALALVAAHADAHDLTDHIERLRRDVERATEAQVQDSASLWGRMIVTLVTLLPTANPTGLPC